MTGESILKDAPGPNALHIIGGGCCAGSKPDELYLQGGVLWKASLGQPESVLGAFHIPLPWWSKRCTVTERCLNDDHSTETNNFPREMPTGLVVWWNQR